MNLGFLGVGTIFVLRTNKKFNVSGEPKNLLIRKLIMIKLPRKIFLQIIIPKFFRLKIVKILEKDNSIKIKNKVKIFLDDLFLLNLKKPRTIVPVKVPKWLDV